MQTPQNASTSSNNTTTNTPNTSGNTNTQTMNTDLEKKRLEIINKFKQALPQNQLFIQLVNTLKEISTNQ